MRHCVALSLSVCLVFSEFLASGLLLPSAHEISHDNFPFHRTCKINWMTFLVCFSVFHYDVILVVLHLV